MPSANFTTASNAQIPAICIVRLVTITAGATVIRFCTDAQDFVSNGNTYTAAGDTMECALYDDRDDVPPRARITFHNVTGALMQALREIDPRDDVIIGVVLVTSDEPDTVQYPWTDARLGDVNYDSLVIEGEVSAEYLIRIGIPALSFDPAGFPAMHAGVP